jgi:hypothetical protein
MSNYDLITNDEFDYQEHFISYENSIFKFIIYRKNDEIKIASNKYEVVYIQKDLKNLFDKEFESVEEEFNFIDNLFQINMVKIKSISIEKLMKIVLTDNNKNIEIILLFNKQSKNIINNIIKGFQNEIKNLKNEISQMKKLINNQEIIDKNDTNVININLAQKDIKQKEVKIEKENDLEIKIQNNNVDNKINNIIIPEQTIKNNDNKTISLSKLNNFFRSEISNNVINDKNELIPNKKRYYLILALANYTPYFHGIRICNYHLYENIPKNNKEVYNKIFKNRKPKNKEIAAVIIQKWWRKKDKELSQKFTHLIKLQSCVRGSQIRKYVNHIIKMSKLLKKFMDMIKAILIRHIKRKIFY